MMDKNKVEDHELNRMTKSMSDFSHQLKDCDQGRSFKIRYVCVYCCINLKFQKISAFSQLSIDIIS